MMPPKAAAREVLGGSGTPSILAALVRKHVYVAAPYAHRDAAAELAIALRGAGVWITSRWHEGPAEELKEADLSRERLAAISTENGADLMISDAIVVLERLGGRATYAEAGITGARGKPILWITPRNLQPPCLLGILQQRIDDGGIVEIIGRMRLTPADFREGSPR